jgi:hypothetical protein
MNPQAPNQPGQYGQPSQAAPVGTPPTTPALPGYDMVQQAPRMPAPEAAPQAPFPQQPAGQPVAPPPQYAAQPAPAAGAPVATGQGQPGVKPVAKTNPNSTQNILQIAEIRDGIVIMSDGTYRSVIMAKSINFDLMSPQEQEAVEYSYQGFLNSLYFPIQIFVRSQKVDLQPYIEKLDKIRTEHDNMLLAYLMEDYINYIDQLSQQTNIMDKKFYIVVPFIPPTSVDRVLGQSKNFFTGLGQLFSSKEQHVVVNEADLEAAKTELRNRVQAMLGGLMQCGIQALPLDTQELIELYYDTYNPDTATRQQLKDFGSMTSDVVMKGQGAAPQQHLQRELQ